MEFVFSAHYVNIESTDWKLSQLMERHKFTSIKESMADPKIKGFLDHNSVSIDSKNNLYDISLTQNTRVQLQDEISKISNINY